MDGKSPEGGPMPPPDQSNTPTLPRRGFLRFAATALGAFVAGAAFKPNTASAQALPDNPPAKTPEGPPAAYAPSPKIEITNVSEMNPEDVAKSKETVVKTLDKRGLTGLVGEIWLMPENKITIDNYDYGKILEDSKKYGGKGHGGYVNPRPDGKFVLVIGIGSDQQIVEGHTDHEGAHMIDPRYQSIIYRPEMLRHEALQNYDKFKKWYKEEILAQGKYVDEYDQVILKGLAAEVGEKTWPIFVKALGLPEDTPTSIPFSQIEEMSANPDFPNALRKIIENHKTVITSNTRSESVPGLNAAIAINFDSTALGEYITQLYFQGSNVLSAFPENLQKELEARIKELTGVAEGETWGNRGQEYFKNPRLVGILYPVFINSFEPIYQNAYQKLTGKKLEPIPQPQQKDGVSRASELWKSIPPDGKRVIMNYLQTEGEDGAQQKLSKSLFNFYSHERRKMAELVDLYMQDPKNLEFAKAA